MPLNEDQERQRTRVHINHAAPSFTRADVDSGSFDASGYDNAFDRASFRGSSGVKVITMSADEVVFDLWGVDASVANALRRVLLAEVPTVAVEKVRIACNTSVIQDEVLAHRLGMIPLKVDPRLFRFRGEGEEDAAPDLRDTVIFDIDVECKKKKKTKADSEASDRFENGIVYSSSITVRPRDKWPSNEEQEKEEGSADAMDVGDNDTKKEEEEEEEDTQKNTKKNIIDDEPPSAELLAAHDAARPVHDDILLAKLRPGQRITAELRAEKGVGRVHAKWSPVSTAFYRLLPEVTITEPITGEDATHLAARCPMGVFDIEDGAAVVTDARKCTMCRECIRPGPNQEKVRLTRVRDHYVFSIESTGALDAADLFREAIRVFKEKLSGVESLLDEGLKMDE